jgi:hypothetical protein
VPVGQYTLTVGFAGDSYYLAASATQTLYVYQPTQFVIWGGNPGGLSVGQSYTFWGAQWSRQVTGGSYAGDASFKGWADLVAARIWTASGGNSTSPPATVAQYIGVIVATEAYAMSGQTSGNITELGVLRVDDPSAYQPNPGHSAAGVLVTTAAN